MSPTFSYLKRVVVYCYYLPADVRAWLYKQVGISDARPYVYLLPDSRILRELRERLAFERAIRTVNFEI